MGGEGTSRDRFCDTFADQVTITLQKLDEQTRYREQAANLRYEGEKAWFEAQSGAAVQQWQARMHQLATINQAVNTRLEGWLGAEDALQLARNYRSQASDALRQAELEEIYARTGYQGDLARASATLAQGFGNLLGTVGQTFG